ncbi:MAG: hypothetical protein JWP97_6420 [Labilithrix sp.]|nr:hypothetical protein [Labilithrix sp.]
MIARVLRLAAAPVCALLLAACGPDYDHTEITGSRASVLGGSVDRTQITVPEGMIVTAHIVPLDDEKKAMALTVRSLDAAIVEAAPVIRNNDWAFVGNRVGVTDVQILADDRVVLTIRARVTAQPAR